MAPTTRVVASLHIFLPATLLCPATVLCAQTPADTTRDTSRIPSTTIVAPPLVTERGLRSVSELLTGRVPNLLVVPASGVTGLGARIRLRGVTSLTDDAAPVVLLDGVRIDVAEDAYSFNPGEPGPLRLDDLNPQDIDSVEVIPASAAAARYGPGSSAGVLVIHTKQGQPGPARWDAYAAGGISGVSTHWPVNFGGVDPNATDPSFREGGCTLRAQFLGECVQQSVQQFNPLEHSHLFGTRPLRRYGLGVSGGSSWMDYRLAGAFEGDGGVYSSSAVTSDANYYHRLTGTVSGRLRPSGSTEVSVSASRTSSDLRLPPNQQILYPLVFGRSDSINGGWPGTLSLSDLFQQRGTQHGDRSFGAITGRWDLVPGVRVTALFGSEHSGQQDAWRWPTAQPSSAGGTRKARSRTLGISAQLTPAVGRNLHLSTLLGLEALRDQIDQEIHVPASGPLGSGSGSSVRRRSSGYYVQQEIGIQERFVVTASLRHDSYGEEHVSTTYPGFGVSWQVRRRGAGTVGPVWLRASYGVTGRRIPTYLLYYVVLPSPPPLLTPLRPERTRSLELGSDATLFADRVGVHVTYFDMNSRAIDARAGAPFGGFLFYPEARIRNRGVEAALSGRILTAARVVWDAELSLWGNRNRVDALKQPLFLTPLLNGPLSQREVEGAPAGGYWAYRFGYSDANHDGIIDPSEITFDPSQPVWAGTPYPTQGAALTTAATFGGRVRVATTLEYRGGQTLFNQTAWTRCLYGTCRSINDPTVPLAAQAQAMGAIFFPATAYFEDAAYVKLREVAVTFTASRAVAAALHARDASVTLTGRNLHTWTGYSGGDPEAGSYGTSDPGTPRIISDILTVPPSRSWTLRLDLTF